MRKWRVQAHRRTRDGVERTQDVDRRNNDWVQTIGVVNDVFRHMFHGILSPEEFNSSAERSTPTVLSKRIYMFSIETQDETMQWGEINEKMDFVANSLTHTRVSPWIFEEGHQITGRIYVDPTCEHTRKKRREIAIPRRAGFCFNQRDTRIPVP